MKSRKDFNTIEEYKSYLLIYFTAEAMKGYCSQSLLTFDIISMYSKKIAERIVNELKIPN